MVLYMLVATFFVGSVPQSVEVGRYDGAFCNAQAAAGNKTFKGVSYRCVPVGPFSGDKIPQ